MAVFWSGQGGTHLGVFDTRLLVGGAVPFTGKLLALDTHRPRIFLADARQIKIVDLGTATISALPITLPFVPPPAAYASLVDRLFVQRASDFTIVDVVDVATGAVVQSINLDVPTQGLGNPVNAMVTDTAGSRLFALTVRGHLPSQLSAFDVVTGSLIKRVDLGDPFLEPSTYLIPFHSLQLDEERGRLLVGTLIVFNAATLERLGATSGVSYGGGSPRFAFTGPRSPFIIFSPQQIGGGYAGEPSKRVIAQLERRNAATGALEAIADIGASTTLTTRPGRFTNCGTQMMMATVPRAPQNVVVAVNGHQVTLSWIDPGNTTHFDIEAGTAPGLANIMSRSVSGTTFTADGVPSGRYYVRVRAINDVGRSVPTSDIEIIVP